MRFGSFVALMMLVSLAACSSEPATRGVGSITPPPNDDKDMKNHRALCALRGDSSCGEYMDDLASLNQTNDKDGSSDRAWYGQWKEVPDSTSESHR